MTTIRDLKEARRLLHAIELEVIDTCDRCDLLLYAGTIEAIPGLAGTGKFMRDFAHGLNQNHASAPGHIAILDYLIME